MAAETVVKLSFLVDFERRRFFFMERASAPEIFPFFSKLYVFTYFINNIALIDQILNILIVDSTNYLHASIITNALDKAKANYGKKKCL